MPSSGQDPTPRKAKRSRAKPASDGDDLVPITLQGLFPKEIKNLRASNMAPLTTFGVDDQGTELLVPLIDWQVYLDESLEEAEGFPTPALSVILSLENTCYLIQDLAADLARAIRTITLQSEGGLQPERGRVQYSAQMLREAATHLDVAAERLETVDGESDPASLL